MRSASQLRTTPSPKARQRLWRAVLMATRPTRIQSHVETCARACEKWGPQWRIITNLDELVELRPRIVMVRLASTERMKLMYGPELSRLSEPAREQLLIALAVLISFESWDQMRHWYDLSMEAVQGVWRSVIDRICRRLDNRRPSTNWKTS
jgi:hypothetical protein